MRLGYDCEIEVLDYYKTSRRFNVAWSKRKGIRLYENSILIEESIYDLINNNPLHRTLVFSGKKTLLSAEYKILGYLIAKYFQLISKHINISQSVRLCSLQFDGHRFKVNRKIHYLYHSTGIMALDYSPELLKKASNGVTTVLVTGTNEKTTVTKMINDGVRAIGIDTIYNGMGANLLGGGINYIY